MAQPTQNTASKQSKVGVVLLTYNRPTLLDHIIRSALPQLPNSTKLLIVDNGSTPSEHERLEALLRSDHRVSILRIEQNVGYAAGMNRGIEQLLKECDWILTLSNDTELDREFFTALESEVSHITDGLESAHIGMLAPKVRAMTERATLDGTGISICIDGMSTARGQREKDQNQYDGEEFRTVLIPNGVAAIYSTKMLREVGLFDEAFYAYCEDTDLGLRAWHSGWSCRYIPSCIVYHQRSATIGEFSLEKLYLVERNHYWVVAKNFPWPLVVLNPLFTIYRYALQAFAVITKRGHQSGYGTHHSATALARATLRGCLHGLSGTPRMILKRKHSVRSTAKNIFELFRARLSLKKLILG